MFSNYRGSINLTIFGGSHEPNIGVVINGLPTGEYIDTNKLEALMQRRAPGNSPFATPRKEADTPVFLSGIDKSGHTDGKPLCAVIQNTNTRSKDYGNIQHIPRPSHADFPALCKFGKDFNLSGGGHFSGRMTAPLLIAGGIAMQILERRGISVYSHIYSVGGERDSSFADIDTDDIGKFDCLKVSDFPVIDKDRGEKMKKIISKVKDEEDSIGGIAEAIALGLPCGLGSHMFRGIENVLSNIIFSIPAVKGVEFGEGFGFDSLTGSNANDEYILKDGRVVTATNHCGGIVGGMTTGMPLILRAAFKPTPSIGKPQRSVDLDSMTEETLIIKGRHDPCILTRGVVALEGAVALGLLDIMKGEGAL